MAGCFIKKIGSLPSTVVSTSSLIVGDLLVIKISSGGPFHFRSNTKK
jgi:hypothetical protein